MSERSSVDRRILIGGVVLAGSAMIAAAGGGQTYAAFSDVRVVPGYVVGAGMWGTDLPLIPEQCTDNGVSPVNWFVITDEGSSWSDGVAALEPLGPGKPGSTVDGAFHGTDDADFIVNLGARRTLHALGGDDCVVAGPGGDIVHGGDGSDVLIGGKQQHKGEHLFAAADVEAQPLAGLEALADLGYLDGEAGTDLCAPGPDDLVANCEAVEGQAEPGPLPSHRELPPAPDGEPEHTDPEVSEPPVDAADPADEQVPA